MSAQRLDGAGFHDLLMFFCRALNCRHRMPTLVTDQMQHVYAVQLASLAEGMRVAATTKTELKCAKYGAHDTLETRKFPADARTRFCDTFTTPNRRSQLFGKISSGVSGTKSI
jgi:hypothetical protein